MGQYASWKYTVKTKWNNIYSLSHSVVQNSNTSKSGGNVEFENDSGADRNKSRKTVQGTQEVLNKQQLFLLTLLLPLLSQEILVALAHSFIQQIYP